MNFYVHGNKNFYEVYTKFIGNKKNTTQYNSVLERSRPRNSTKRNVFLFLEYIITVC